MRGLRRVPLPLIVAVLVTVAVTGCSDGHPKDPSVGSVRTTAPETGFLSQQVIGRDEQMLDEGLTVTWLNEDEIAVTTWGSGSCPLLPLRLIGTDLDQLILDTGVPDDTPCTADMSATTTTIERPVAWPVGTELRLSTVDGEQVLEPVDRAADRLRG